MSLLASFGIKQTDGTWKNYTISINDKSDKNGNNVSVYESQTKEEIAKKKPKTYLGSAGKVFWTNGTAVKGEKPAIESNEPYIQTNTQGGDDSLPF